MKTINAEVEEREREREREREKRERGRECVCICVCERDRDRDRELQRWTEMGEACSLWLRDKQRLSNKTSRLMNPLGSFFNSGL